MSFWNKIRKIIHFDFPEHCFTSVHRLPRPHLPSLKLRKSEEGGKEPKHGCKVACPGKNKCSEKLFIVLK